MIPDLKNIVYSYLDLEDILRLPNKSQILQTQYFRDYNWLYDKFGIINDYYKNLILKNEVRHNEFISRYNTDWRYFYMDINDIQLYKNKESILQNGLGENMNDTIFTLKSLKKIIFETIEREQDDQRDITDQRIETLTIDQIFNYIESIINAECETVGIHPEYYPIGYLCTGILYANNWQKLADLDIDKFAYSYGIDLELTYNQKIIEIIKAQNKIFKSILDSGEDGDCRDCPIIKKLIQMVIDNEIIFDGGYNDNDFLDGYEI
jgi:hypothetical protein